MEIEFRRVPPKVIRFGELKIGDVFWSVQHAAIYKVTDANEQLRPDFGRPLEIVCHMKTGAVAGFGDKDEVVKLSARLVIDDVSHSELIAMSKQNLYATRGD